MLNITVSLDLGTYGSACDVLIEREDGGEFPAREAAGGMTRKLKVSVVSTEEKQPKKKDRSELKSYVSGNERASQVMDVEKNVFFRDVDPGAGRPPYASFPLIAWASNYKLVLYPEKLPANANPAEWLVPFSVSSDPAHTSPRVEPRNLRKGEVSLLSVYERAYNMLIEAAFSRIRDNIAAYKGDYCVKLIITIPVITDQARMRFIKGIVASALDARLPGLTAKIPNGRLCPPRQALAGHEHADNSLVPISLSYEPEGAFRTAIDEFPSVFGEPGETRSIVVDLGGGTLDLLALMNVTSLDADDFPSYRVSELHTKGGTVGGARLDALLIEFLNGLVAEVTRGRDRPLRIEGNERRAVEDASRRYREKLKDPKLTMPPPAQDEDEFYIQASDFVDAVRDTYSSPDTTYNIKHGIEIPRTMGEGVLASDEFCTAVDVYIANKFRDLEDQYAQRGKSPSTVAYMNAVTIYPVFIDEDHCTALQYIEEHGLSLPRKLKREQLEKIPYGKYLIYDNRNDIASSLSEDVLGLEGGWKMDNELYYTAIVEPFLDEVDATVGEFLGQLTDYYTMDEEEVKKRNRLEANRDVINPSVIRFIQDEKMPWNIIFTGGMSLFFPLRYRITNMICNWAEELYPEPFGRESLHILPLGNPSMAVVSGASMQCQMKYVTAETICRPSDSTYGIRMKKLFGLSPDKRRAEKELAMFKEICEKCHIVPTFGKGPDGEDYPMILNYLHTFLRAGEVPAADFDNGIIVSAPYSAGANVAINIFVFAEQDVRVVPEGTKPQLSLTVRPDRPNVSDEEIERRRRELRANYDEILAAKSQNLEDTGDIEQLYDNLDDDAREKAFNETMIYYKIQLDLRPYIVVTVTQVDEEGTPIKLLKRMSVEEFAM